ncbi:ankyrin repeat domain-containing protein, partial [Candidatus Jidaibacter acanthamoebae]
MKRKIEETLPASNKESRIDDTQVFEYEIEDPILLKIIECARNRNHEELQRIPNLDINKMDYKIGLSAVAILANNEEVEAIKFLEPYGINKNLLVYGFAMGGHGEHMKKLLNQGTSKDFTIAGAARGGQKELVEWLLSQGASKDHAVAGAAHGRHKELVEWLLSQGASKGQAVFGAALGGHKELVEWLLSQGASKDHAVAGA